MNFFGTVAYDPRSHYRPDIDGMRAFAVLVVVAFHYFPGHFPGGFVGVDVFFVISGYLITGIIAEQMERNEFSILNFYRRRVLRIFPGLSLILFFVLVVGWFKLIPDDYATLGKYIAGGSAFVENFVFWSGSGYFDSDAISKPLLHLWSLAIEEQFYLFWPIILWIFITIRRSAKKVIATVGAISFFVNLWYISQGDGTAAFYSPLSRAWELMMGAWLAISHREPEKMPLIDPIYKYWAGFGLLFVSVWVIRESGFPGFWALLPTFGTMLLIDAGPSKNPRWSIFNYRPAVWVGLISYPLYLWHWVLLSMMSAAVGQGRFSKHEFIAIKIALIVISVILSLATYEFLEKPIRRTKRTLPAWALTSTVAFLGAAGLSVYLSQGYQIFNAHRKINESALTALNGKAIDLPKINNGWCFYTIDTIPTLQPGLAGTTCNLGSPEGKIKALLFGDSFAGQYEPFWDNIGHEAGISIRSVTTNWCYPSFGIQFTGPESSPSYQQCIFNRKWVDENLGKYDVMIVAGAYFSMEQKGQLGEFVNFMRQVNSRIKIIVMPLPKSYGYNFMQDFKKSLMLDFEMPPDKIGIENDNAATKIYKNLINTIKTDRTFFMKRESLFSNGSGMDDFTSEGIPYTWDGGHISIYGSEMAAQNFKRNGGVKDLNLFFNTH